ncbi:hypothetical protein UPYG_G00291900 [Umbra pygmaea]|uniref:Uncharacterized protein n=1 Tax=Umbra pygmaea TaxID=75934 RepID=A0ABD0W4X9_UMBPY
MLSKPMENLYQYMLETIQEEVEKEVEDDKKQEELVNEEETEKRTTTEESDECPLKVRRASRQSSSLDQISSARVENLPVPYPIIPLKKVGHRDKVNRPGITLPGTLRAEADREDCGAQLEMKPEVTNNKRWKRTTRRQRPSLSDEESPTPQKKAGPKRRQRKDGPFPEWLVNLMHNIEEATTHELVVE